MEEIHKIGFNTSLTIVLTRELDLRQNISLEQLYHFAKLRLIALSNEESQDIKFCPNVEQIQKLSNLSNHIMFVAAIRKLIGFK